MEAAEQVKSQMKSREHDNWTRVAAGWRKHDGLQRTRFAPVTERLLDAAGVGPGGHVLDIASGTGEPAIPAAVRVGASGSVVGYDFVEEMLAFAREKAETRGLTNIDFHTQDGEILEVPTARFDAVTMRWGLMFMPDPVSCLRKAHQALKPEGKIALSCWAAPEKNPWAAIPMGAVRRRANPPPPVPGATGMFAFADPGRLTATLQEAGFRDVTVEEVKLRTVDFPNGADFFRYTCELAGPIAGLFAQLDQNAQEEVAREVAVEVEQRSLLPGRVALDGVTWVACGRK